MGTLKCTEARDFSRDEPANLQLKDEIGNASLRKSNMSEIIEGINTPGIHGQNQNGLCKIPVRPLIYTAKREVKMRGGQKIATRKTATL